MSQEKAWKTQYKKIWNEVESQLFEKMATEPIKREGRYVSGKLKTWKERIKTNFHGQDVPYNMHCNASAVLKILSTNKEKIIILMYMLRSVDIPMQKTNNAACGVMMMMMDFLRCKKRRPKTFLETVWSYKTDNK